MRILIILSSITFVFILGTLSIIYIPEYYYNEFVYDGYFEYITITESETIKNEFRKVLIAIVGGSLAVGGFILTYYRTKNQDETLSLTQRGQWNDRYVKAIELIDNKSSDIKIGGIYSLISIAEESFKHKEAIIKILCSYVRENLNIKKRDLPDDLDNATMEKMKFERERFPIDHETILNFLSKLPVQDRLSKDGSLLLLRFIDFSFYHIGPLNLSHSEMSEIDFTYSKINKLNLSKSKIHNITIRYTQSSEINFENSIIVRSHFDKTNLIVCEFMNAKLMVVDFRGSILNYCSFHGADLQGVDFEGTALIGCDFTNAKISDIEALLKTKSLWQSKFNSEVTAFINEKKKELFDPAPNFDPFYIIK
ncbi:pentapeptide repeat-containing protein [Leptospira santarosai]|uniref:pentapeptide repeat-containing protein n=1 Tax=Leptospira santarosai TaxID=28183 RepID=UPI0002B9FE90|nr:pentapeptide repeat-containing protein [Leptospira santarosai]EMF91279.1 pentapeptide repeat protein [Leptospira santarosai str. ST188]EMJ46026.1 pentapeptide repeat protein [Leptospira santarosai str. HAI1349]